MTPNIRTIIAGLLALIVVGLAAYARFILGSEIDFSFLAPLLTFILAFAGIDAYAGVQEQKLELEREEMRANIADRRLVGLYGPSGPPSLAPIGDTAHWPVGATAPEPGDGLDIEHDGPEYDGEESEVAEGGAPRSVAPSRRMKPEDWSQIKFFKPTEFKYPDRMDYQFMLWLDKVRARAGVPFRRTSDYRPPAYNEAVGGATNSAHMDTPCQSIDLSPRHGLDRFKIVKAALDEGCIRIGIYRNGSLHLDRTEGRRPAPNIWTVV